jgi:DNA-binding transcriptional regulator YhcF (GntR family)
MGGGTVIVHVDAASALPVFEQLRTQITRLIVSGQLRPGSRLPAIRDLANDLGLARGTINKVYDLLARDGLVETSGRHGTVVLEGPPRSTTAADLRDAADAVALVARQLGLDRSVVHRAVDEALDRLERVP